MYMIWRSCERFGILPPGIRSKFENNTNWNCARLMAYEQLRQVEDVPDFSGLFPRGKK